MNKEVRFQNKSKILKGLELAYEKMLLFKKQQQTELVVTKNHKIIKIKRLISNAATQSLEICGA